MVEFSASHEEKRDLLGAGNDFPSAIASDSDSDVLVVDGRKVNYLETRAKYA
jgi:hypothetical protein